MTVNSQLVAALVSGGAAVIVAVLGIGGAIAAQLFATRRAFENSLALQERQYARQERERQQQAQREDAYRFAEQRRATYGRFVRLGREFVDAVDTERTVAKNLQRIGRQRDRMRSSSPELDMSADAAERLVADARERLRRLRAEFGSACEEIRLLGSLEVRQAADRLWDVAQKATHWADRDCDTARTAFLEAVRHELGIAAIQHSHVPRLQEPASHGERLPDGVARPPATPQ
jgi:hypothetical protein